jgi:tRNA threonylcarbamoyladenosine biosynthesis protein TsaE
VKQAVRSLEEGQAWVKSHRAIWDTPGLILLSGPMGAGKTQLTTWILKELGIENGASPTFAIHHRYSVGGDHVDHFDLYRLKSDADLETTGFWDVVNEVDNLVIVEWADRLPDDSYPRNRHRHYIEISAAADGERTYSLRSSMEE